MFPVLTLKVPGRRNNSLVPNRKVKPLKLTEKRIIQVKHLRRRLCNHPQRNYVIKDDEERRLVLALISHWLKQFKPRNCVREK